MMRKAPFREDRTASADDARAALDGQRDVSQQNPGMNREIVHALLRLLDESVSIEFPCQVLGPAAALLEGLIDRNRANRNRGISENPFPGLMDVASAATIHHGVRAQVDTPPHLL